jgi:branched-chain amino acid transport system substrate-binding protein
MIDHFRPVKTYIFALLLSAFPLTAQGDLKVGFIGGFSGTGQMFGEAAKNGFELARAEFGDQGLTVVYEDDQFDPKKSVAAFNKLVQRDKVDVVISLGSTPAAALAPLAERLGVPMLAWANARQIALGRKWVIRSWVSGEEEGGAIASKANELKISRLATIAYTDQYANSVVNGVRTASKPSTIPLGEVSSIDQDFTALILRAKKQGADGIFACLSVGQAARFAMQCRQLQFAVPILGCETFNSSTEVDLSKGALNGAWYATVEVSPEFRERFKKRFSADTSIGGSGVHYELYRILLEIASSSPSREQLRERLLSIRDRDSVLGKFSIISDKGDQWFKLPVSMQQAAVGSQSF